PVRSDPIRFDAPDSMVLHNISLEETRQTGLIFSFRFVGSFTDRPRQPLGFALAGGKFDLKIGCLGEEPCGRFGEEREFYALNFCRQLAFLSRNHNFIVLASETIQQGDWQGKLLFARFSKFTYPNISKSHRVSVVLQGQGLFFWMRLVR